MYKYTHSRTDRQTNEYIHEHTHTEILQKNTKNKDRRTLTII